MNIFRELELSNIMVGKILYGKTYRKLEKKK